VIVLNPGALNIQIITKLYFKSGFNQQSQGNNGLFKTFIVLNNSCL